MLQPGDRSLVVLLVVAALYFGALFTAGLGL